MPRRPTRETLFAMVVTAILSAGLVAASGQAPAQPKSLLSIFRVGQHVGVHIAPNGFWQIIVHNDVPAANGQAPQSATVSEVGTDYIALREPGVITESRIPISAILSVITTIKP